MNLLLLCSVPFFLVAVVAVDFIKVDTGSRQFIDPSGKTSTIKCIMAK
jgi:hypothetical protein